MLKWEGPLSRFKQRLASGEDVFGQLLDRFLLENKHRVTIVTLPDTELAKQVEAKEKERIITARSQMSADEVRPTLTPPLPSIPGPHRPLSPVLSCMRGAVSCMMASSTCFR